MSVYGRASKTVKRLIKKYGKYVSVYRASSTLSENPLRPATVFALAKTVKAIEEKREVRDDKGFVTAVRHLLHFDSGFRVHVGDRVMIGNSNISETASKENTREVLRIMPLEPGATLVMQTVEIGA